MQEVDTNKVQPSVVRVPLPWVNLGQPDAETLLFRGLRGREKWVVWTRASIRQGPLHTLALETLS